MKIIKKIAWAIFHPKLTYKNITFKIVMWRINHSKDITYWLLIICIFTSFLSAYSWTKFYQHYLSLEEPTTMIRTIGEVSIVPSPVVIEVANASMLPEEEYYDLLENDKNFSGYINSINVPRNNPGNIRCAGQPNSTCVDGFAAYINIVDGFRGLIKQVELDQSRDFTIESFLYKYAPPIENDTEKMIFQMVDRLGLTRETKINSINTILLAKDITMQEHSINYDRD